MKTYKYISYMKEYDFNIEHSSPFLENLEFYFYISVFVLVKLLHCFHLEYHNVQDYVW